MIDPAAFCRLLDERDIGEGPRELARLIAASSPALTFSKAVDALKVHRRSLLRYEDVLMRAGLLRIIITWDESEGRVRRYELLP